MKSPHRRLWRWLLAAALLLLACNGLQQIDPATDPITVEEAAQPGPRIAYIGADFNVYIFATETDEITAVTDDGGETESTARRYNYPTWSPDGRQLAFVGLERDGRERLGTLYAVDVEALDRQSLYTTTRNFPFYLYWSPDSRNVSFLAPHTGGELALQLAPIGNGDTRLLDVGQPYYWQFAPDSERVFVHVGGSAGRLAFLNVSDGETQTELGLEPVAFQAPSWSPDGQQILVAAADEAGNWALMVTDSNGQNSRVLATIEERGVAFGWSPDGAQVAMITGAAPERGAVGALSLVNPESGGQTPVTDAGLVLAFFWSPDSQKLAYFVLSDAPFGFERQASTLQRVQTGRLFLELRVYDRATALSRSLGSFAPTEEFLSVLPFFDQYQHSVRLWSPDSANLVVAARHDDEAGIWLMSTDENMVPRRLADGLVAFWSWE